MFSSQIELYHSTMCILDVIFKDNHVSSRSVFNNNHEEHRKERAF